MGIPAYFRWISERYPKIMVDCVEFVDYDEDTGTERRIDASKANPNGLEFDNLYLDMNGIIHPCTHPEDGPAPTTEQEMFDAVCAYVDRVFSIVRPRRLLYMAIDGVAPRAKINQQRSRRFRSAREAEEQREEKKKLRSEWRDMGLQVAPEDPDAPPPFDSNVITPGTPFMSRLAIALRSFVAERLANDSAWRGLRVLFSDASMPGEGEHKIAEFIRVERAQPGYDPVLRHVMYGLDADLIMLALSTHEVCFSILREEVFQKRGEQRNGRGVGPGGSAANPRGSHSSYDQSGREVAQIDSTLDPKFRSVMQADGLQLRKEIGNRKPFHFLHVNVLREYLDAEYRDDIEREIADAPGTEVLFNLERVIDDFVFLCFFVGNDFLPHLPTLDIREGAVDYLIELYKTQLPQIGYLTSDGGEVDFARVRKMLLPIGLKEDEIFKERARREVQKKQRRERDEQDRARERKDVEELVGPARPNARPAPAAKDRRGRRIGTTLAPEGEPMVALGIKNKTPRYGSGENNARAEAAVRAVLARPDKPRNKDGSSPALKRKKPDSEEIKPSKKSKTLPSNAEGGASADLSGGAGGSASDANDGGDEAKAPAITGSGEVKTVAEFKDALHQRMREKNVIKQPSDDVKLGEDGWKARYYENKFHWKEDDVAPKQDLLRTYFEGLYWVMKYYYSGCISWGWYYPYHYAPFASDLVECDIVTEDIHLDMGVPFKPFTQLQAVMPASSGKLVLPKCYSDLMTNPMSPILDYYPEDFELDLNGKRFAWQGVALLPFIDEKRLNSAIAGLDSQLTDEERKRNSFGECHIVTARDSDLGRLAGELTTGTQTVVPGEVAAGLFFGTVSSALSGSTESVVFSEFHLPPFKPHSSALLPDAVAPAPQLHDGHRTHFRHGGWKLARFGSLGRAARELSDARLQRAGGGPRRGRGRGRGGHNGPRNARPHAGGAGAYSAAPPTAQHAWMQRSRHAQPHGGGGGYGGGNRSRYAPPAAQAPHRAPQQPQWVQPGGYYQGGAYAQRAQQQPYQRRGGGRQHHQYGGNEPSFAQNGAYQPQWAQGAYQPYHPAPPYGQQQPYQPAQQQQAPLGGGLAGPTASLLRRGGRGGRGRGRGGGGAH